MLVRLTSALFLLFFSLPALAEIHWVSNTGTATTWAACRNDGAAPPATPPNILTTSVYCTYAQANTNAAAGDTVYYRAGDYKYDLNLGTFIRPSKSGNCPLDPTPSLIVSTSVTASTDGGVTFTTTPTFTGGLLRQQLSKCAGPNVGLANRITFAAYPGETVIFEQACPFLGGTPGCSTSTGTTHQTNGIVLLGVSWIHVTGFQFKNTTYSFGTITLGASYNEVDHCSFQLDMTPINFAWAQSGGYVIGDGSTTSTPCVHNWIHHCYFSTKYNNYDGPCAERTDLFRIGYAWTNSRDQANCIPNAADPNCHYDATNPEDPQDDFNTVEYSYMERSAHNTFVANTHFSVVAHNTAQNSPFIPAGDIHSNPVGCNNYMQGYVTWGATVNPFWETGHFDGNHQISGVVVGSPAGSVNTDGSINLSTALIGQVLHLRTDANIPGDGTAAPLSQQHCIEAGSACTVTGSSCSGGVCTSGGCSNANICNDMRSGANPITLFSPNAIASPSTVAIRGNICGTSPYVNSACTTPNPGYVVSTGDIYINVTDVSTTSSTPVSVSGWTMTQHWIPVFYDSSNDGKFGHRTFSLGDNHTEREPRRNLAEANRTGYSSMNPGNGGDGTITVAFPQNIVRYNFVYASMVDGIYFKWADGSAIRTPSKVGLGQVGGINNYVYNNTTAHNGSGYNLVFNGSSGAVHRGGIGQLAGTPTHNRIRNNIAWDNPFGDICQIGQLVPNSCAPVITTSTAAGVGNGDLVVHNWCKSTDGTAGGCSGVGDPAFLNATYNVYNSQEILPSAPGYAEHALPDLRLGNSSPAIDGGTYLTTAVGSSTTVCGVSPCATLVVADAGFFQDGTLGSDLARGVTLFPDWIAIGTVGNYVSIAPPTAYPPAINQNVNYSTNTITLASPTTWADGAPVWLYKRADGQTVLIGNAPDYGAFEFQAPHGSIVLGPTGLNGAQVIN